VEALAMKEMDLIRLVEECGELIQAAGKILRFGVKGEYCNGTPNMEALTTECGDVLACIQRLELDDVSLSNAVISKRLKISKLEKYELGFNCELTRAEREELHGK
jgi:hypothetical protein